MKLALAIAALVLLSTGIASAQAPPPGWFCTASPSQPGTDACFRERAACEKFLDSMKPTVADIAGCSDLAGTPPVVPAAPAVTDKPAEEENLLANLKVDDEPPKQAEPASTYGHQLKIFGVETTIGGYGDTTFRIVPKEKEANFDAHHFNPIISARMTDTLSAEMELEIEHGIEIEIEYAMVDWTPFESRSFVVRAGKFQIPIGKFNEQYHPSFRYQQVGRPQMFEEVVPVGWSDVGLQLRGVVGTHTTFEYQTWIVNGLRRAHDPEPAMVPAAEEEEEEEGGFVRGLRSEAEEDNNFDKAFGGRFGVNVGKRSDPISGSIAMSGQTGKIDSASTERLSTLDVDAHLTVHELTLNVEAAQTFLGRKHHYLDRFERGVYVQAAYTVGKWTPAVRWEYLTTVEVEDEANPGDGEKESAQLIAGSIAYAPAKQWSVRGELAIPYRPEGATEELSLSAMIAFVF